MADTDDEMIEGNELDENIGLQGNLDDMEFDQEESDDLNIQHADGEMINE